LVSSSPELIVLAADRLLSRSTLSLMALTIALSCTRGGEPAARDSAASVADSASVRRTIDSLDARLDSAILRQDMAAIVDALSEDYVSLERPGQYIRGRTAYRASLDSLAKAGRFTAFDYQREGLDVSGDLAVGYGRWTMTFVPTGKDAETEIGNFMQVWRRQADGSWRIAREITNTVRQRPATPSATVK
jgi:ketosteroid isomerase-like protein